MPERKKYIYLETSGYQMPKYLGAPEEKDQERRLRRAYDEENENLESVYAK